MPSSAGTLVVAQRKTGKTSLVLNCARSLITGEPFLGEFEVQKISGRVGILNYEMSAGQLGGWAAQVRSVVPTPEPARTTLAKSVRG